MPEGWVAAGNCKDCPRRLIQARQRKGIREKDEMGTTVVN